MKTAAIHGSRAPWQLTGAALALLLAAPVVAADGAGKPGVVAFNASVRVDVDASGKPVKVEAPADLPESIRSFIEKRVASWQYSPARQGGVPAPAVTYVRVGACAIPDATSGGYKLGLDFKGNGPRLVSASGNLPPPQYPSEALRKSISGAYKVSYAIQPDGSTQVRDIELVDGPNRSAKWLRPAINRWAESLRYEPEQVNGQAVVTNMSFPVEFKITTDTARESTEAWRARYKAELEARAMASTECLLASGGPAGLTPIALDSPVTVIPTPAG